MAEEGQESLSNLAQAELEQATSDQLRKLSQDLRTLMKSEGWALLDEMIDKKLKKSLGLLSRSAPEMARIEGGEGAIDGIVAREFRGGYVRGILDIQAMPEVLAEWAEEQAEQEAEREARQEEMRGEDGE